MNSLPREEVRSLLEETPRTPEEELARREEILWSEGCYLVKGALSAEATAYFLKRIQYLHGEAEERGDKGIGTLTNRGIDFLELGIHQPVHGLAKRILGEDMHFWLFIAHTMRRGKTVSGWHADDLNLLRPRHIPDEVEFPPVINVLNCHYYLTDVPLELGPTEVVPTSHRACRDPMPSIDGIPPSWRGRKPISFTVEAGDCVVYSNHCWHRGAPNETDRTRFSIVPYYTRRFIQMRWREQDGYGGSPSPIDEALLSQCTPEQRELLGFHEQAPWQQRFTMNARWIDGKPAEAWDPRSERRPRSRKAG